VLNVTEKLSPGCIPVGNCVDESHDVASPTSDVVVWAMLVAVLVQVMVVPTVTVMVFGSNLRLSVIDTGEGAVVVPLA
jgi:hypothetical protein